VARTPSNMPPLGMEAPPFRLPDTEGRLVGLEDAKAAKGYLVMFLCNHCPFVIHIRPQLAALTGEYQRKGIAVFGINANDAEAYPLDSPAKMKEEKKNHRYEFPYLYDESQAVARAYRAACTPDFFLFDSDKRLVYRGQFDDSRPNSDTPVTGADLRGALDEVLAGRKPSVEQRPSLGCNIKWKA
jgi:peroxiredoxin